MSIRCSITTCLKSFPASPSFAAMVSRTHQLVVQYDGHAFRGWQRQPDERTVQGELEAAVSRLFGAPTAVLGAGRTDAGVHATGQAVGVRAPERWTPHDLRRALNAVLPPDLWVADVREMTGEFHARYDATARRYRYLIACEGLGRSPFRNRWEWDLRRTPDLALLRSEATALLGEHAFHGFAVKGTAPPDDDHRCIIRSAEWAPRADHGLVFVVEANRFLHHMVRFLVGTMVEVATGRRPAGTVAQLLTATDNADVSAPAPAHGLYLEHVEYPAHCYLAPRTAAAA
jgi:tRNA pseudouridine38-40 synthase